MTNPEEKERRRKKFERKLRNPFARALHEELRFIKRVEGKKKDRLRPQDIKRILEEDEQ